MGRKSERQSEDNFRGKGGKNGKMEKETEEKKKRGIATDRVGGCGEKNKTKNQKK